MLIHSIEANDVMQGMSVGSKLNADWDLVNKLMKGGRERAGAWIAGNFARLGKQSTTDIHEKYLLTTLLCGHLRRRSPLN